MKTMGKHPEWFYQNPQQYKDQPVEITLKNERLDESSLTPLAPGVILVGQISKTGKRVPVTHGEQRLFLCLQDDAGKRSMFYQSFSGTGGKEQGVWFPTGGIMADQRGRGAWVIKGNPKTDPGAGRVPLLEFFQRVNEVLPHTDPATDALIMKLVGMDYGDLSYKDDYEIVPFLRITEAGTSSELQKKWGSWSYQFWALNILDKVWGKRTFDPSKVAANPYKAAIPIVSGIAYVRNGGKSYADLMEELRWLGPGVVARTIQSNTMSNCSEFAGDVAQYLLERGFETASTGTEGHYSVAVNTADRGWIKTDPTDVQFSGIPWNESNALQMGGIDLSRSRAMSTEAKEAVLEKVFEPTIAWSVEGLLTGLSAFKISNWKVPARIRLFSPDTVKGQTMGRQQDPSWRAYWSYFRKMAEDLTKPDMGDWEFIRTWYWAPEVSRRMQGKRIWGSNTKINPVDLEGRFVPERYLAGLPPALQKQRIRELTESRDAYKKGDYSELPTDRTARKMGLVKQSNYTTEAKKRGVEYRGDADDMAERTLKFYGHRPSAREVEAFAEALRASFAKGLAAWKSGGHRPGATAQNWAVARVNSLVVGGKTSWTADKKLFEVLPAEVRAKIESMRTKQNPISVQVQGSPPEGLTGRHARYFLSQKALDRIEQQGAPVVPNIQFVVVWSWSLEAGKGTPGVITLVTSPAVIQAEADRLDKAFGKSSGGVPREGKVSLFTAHTVLHRLGDMIMPDEVSMGRTFRAPFIRRPHRDLVITNRVERAWRALGAVLFEAGSTVNVAEWLATVVDTKGCREGWIKEFGQAMAELVPYRLLYKNGRENGVKLLSDLPFVPALEAALTEFIDASMEMLTGYQVKI